MMPPRFWYLEDDPEHPVPTDDVLVWGQHFDRDKRRVAWDKVGIGFVSTVFLGIDHGYGNHTRPILWESMVFHGPLDGSTYRYSSYKAAVKGHQRLLRATRRANKPRLVFRWLLCRGGLKQWIQWETTFGRVWRRYELRKINRIHSQKRP